MVDKKISELDSVAAVAAANQVPINEAGTTKKFTVTQLSTYFDSATQTYTNKTIDADGTGNSITNIENADIKAAAAIDFSKLATLTSGNILVGNGTNVATSVAMSGDVTIDNAGVTTVANGSHTHTEADITDLGTAAALVADNLSVFAATTSAQLAGVISDETGTGALVFASSPALVTPDLGTPSALTLTNATGLPITGITSSTSAELATLLSDETGSGLAVFGTNPTFAQSIFLTEQAAAGADVAGDGQLWVKNNAPNQLYFTDDAGTDALVQRSTTFVVAATGASAQTKAMADYICDGTADEVQINQAFTDLPAAGGIVQLSEGSFTIAAPVTPSSKSWFRGAGMGITLIQTAASYNNHMINFVTKTFIKMSDMEVDGTNQITQNHMVRISNCQDGEFWNLDIHDAIEHSFHTRDATCARLHVHDIYVHNSGARAGVGESGGFIIGDTVDSVFENLIVDGTELHGFQLKLTTNNITLANSVIKNAGKNGSKSGHGIRLEDPTNTNTTITNCVVEDTQNSGISLSGPLYTNISNCLIDGTTAAVNGDGITIRDSAKHVTVTGCNIRDVDDAGVFLRSTGVRDITIAGCIIENVGTQGIENNDADFITIDGNVIVGSAGDGIHNENTTTNVSMTGNVIESNGGQGIEIPSGMDLFTCVGNNVNNNTGGDIVDSSTTTEKVIDNNLTSSTSTFAYKVVEEYVPVDLMTIPTTIPAAAVTNFEGATDALNYRYSAFDGTAIEALNYTWVPPEAWDAGTIKVRFYWTSATAGTVEWDCAAVIMKNSDNLNGTFGTLQLIVDSINPAEDMGVSDYTPAITIAGTLGKSAAVILEIRRNPTSASDTNADDAKLIGMKIQYTIDASDDR